MAKNYIFRRPQIAAAFRRQVIRGLDVVGIMVQNAIKTGLGAHGSGKGGTPSPAGSPPAVQTGALRRSIQVDRSQVETKLRVRIGTGLRYARIHEYGGTITAKHAPALVFEVAPGEIRRVKSVRLPARPYLRPGLKKSKRKVRLAFRKALKGLRI